MRQPEHIFIYCLIVLLIAQSWIILKYSITKKVKALLIKTMGVFGVCFFCYCWFVPIELGWHGMLPVCKFRFQVYEYDTHDYNGHGDISDLFFNLKPKKYGMIDFHQKVGGYKSYFGITSLKINITEASN